MTRNFIYRPAILFHTNRNLFLFLICGRDVNRFRVKWIPLYCITCISSQSMLLYAMEVRNWLDGEMVVKMRWLRLAKCLRDLIFLS